MPTKRITQEVNAPFKGYLSGNAPKGASGYFSKCLNAYFDKAGCAIKRPGFSSHDVAPAALGDVSIDGMFRYVKQGTSGTPTTRTMFHCGGNIYAVPNAYYLENSTAIKTGMTEGALIDHAILSDKYYCANGNEVLQVYDGSTIANITTPPASGLTGDFTPSIIEVHRWSLWAAGVPGNPSRLYKSVPQDGTDFNTNLAVFDTDSGYPLVGAAQIDVRPDDGTGIIGFVGDHFGQLIIFKGNSIHRILGASKADYVLAPEGVIDGIETVKGSIVRANNDVFFASRKGIHRLSTVIEYGDNKESFLSLPIQEYYDSLDKFSITTRCQGIHWSEISCILWAFSTMGAAQNDVVLVYNYAINAWSIWDGINVKSFGIFKFDGANTLFIGDYTSRIGRANFAEKNDFDDPFTMEIEAEFFFGDRALYKGWRSCFLSFNRLISSIKIKHKVDNSDWSNSKTITPATGVILGEFTLDEDYLVDDSESETQALDINETGRILTLSIQNDDLNGSAQIQGISVQAVPQGKFFRQLTRTATPDVTTYLDEVALDEDAIIYFGEDETEGSWRITRLESDWTTVSDDLIFYSYLSGTWVEVYRITL